MVAARFGHSVAVATAHEISNGEVVLAVEEAGEGPAVMLLHGLTATHRYVVMGSHLLERAGYRVISYDARGHGGSSPAADPSAYTYDHLRGDLIAVMDELAVDRAVLAGASMGAHTLLSMALAEPDRVAGLVVITPAYDGSEVESPVRLARWDALAAGLRAGGVDGFVAAYGEPAGDPRWRETVLKVIRQRLALHEHPEAVADALQAVPRSRPFARVDDLRRVDAPAVIVASGDAADPEHPQAVGERYAETIPGARLVLDPLPEDGSDAVVSPIAWQGSRLSKLIGELAAEAF
jgi:pimeloyl-ACP methyl ester carboxylesterase